MPHDVKSTGPKQPQKVPEEYELKELKPTKKSAAPKKTSDISHLSISEDSKKAKEQQPIDGHKPMLPTPVDLSIKEVNQIRQNLEEKFTKPTERDIMQQRLSEHSKTVQDHLNKATEKINKVLDSKLSFEAKTLAIQGILMEIMNISLDISGEHAKVIGFQQSEEKKERFELILKQQDTERKAARTSLISKIFGWIGDVVNLIFAVLTTVALAIAAIPSGGLSGPLLAASVAWISGAVIGVSARAIDQSEVLKGSKAEWLGMALTFASIVLSLAGVAVSGGAAAMKTGEAVATTVKTALGYFTKLTSMLRVVGETSVQATGAYYKYKIAGFEAKKIDKEKEENNLMYTFNNLISWQKKILESLERLSNDMSSRYAQFARSISTIGGNI